MGKKQINVVSLSDIKPIEESDKEDDERNQIKEEIKKEEETLAIESAVTTKPKPKKRAT